ncbi:MAG TPA: sugar ABC transporter permease [Firmicutes bacterium]|nr:sugar ABC transporter permease [Bacillota bacterium]
MRESLLRKLSRKVDALDEGTFSYLISSPALILFLLLGAFPIIYSLGFSLWNYRLNVPSGRHFVGLANYISMFHDPVFLGSLVKTAYYTVATVCLSTGLGLIAALLLNQSFVGKGIFLLTMLVPWAIPKVVNGLMWKWIYDGNYGILNAILMRLGLIHEYQWWFVKSPAVAMTLVILADVWKNVPFAALLLLAALQAVPISLYEAARCDGANAWQQFKHVTIPGIRYTLMMVLILQTMWSLKAFDLIYTLTRGGPGTNTTITYYYVYQQAFDYLNLGYGSALAYFVALVIIIFSAFYVRILGRAD